MAAVTVTKTILELN